MTKIKLTSKREKGGSFIMKTFATLIAIMMAIPAFAQTVDVSGTVLDDQGEPLIGVTVIVEGTSNGTATDFDGIYSLKNVPSKGKLVFSYIGYNSLEVNVDGNVLSIRSNAAVEITVASIDGKAVASDLIDNFSESLESCIYILKAGQKTMKIKVGK